MNKSNSKKHIMMMFFCLLGLLFVAPMGAMAQTANNTELEDWVKENANDSVKITAEDEPLDTAVNDEAVEAVDTIQPAELLAQIDSATIADKAKENANPSLMDKVFIYPSKSKSMKLTNSDSTIQALRAAAERDMRLNDTYLFVVHKDDLPSIEEIMNVNNNVEKNIKVEVDEAKKEDVTIEKPKESFWTFGGDFAVQVSQNYISSNWYKGGESNLNGTASAVGTAKYDNKKNIQWDNKAEWRLGMNSATGDSLRSMRVNQDLFSITSKLGIKAFNNFYYTAEGEFTTQFCNTYVPNSYERVTAPFSPIRTYLSVGLDYKYKDIISVFISPASYKFVHVSDTSVHASVDPSLNIARKFGVTPGKQSLHQMGGLLKVTFDYTFVDVIRLQSLFSLYSNYIGDTKGVELDWEIKADFLINRFFSARLILHPRYDTIVKLPDNAKPKLQFNELLSVGFNYKL